jgi:metallo-beta-lactamase family protein
MPSLTFYGAAGTVTGSRTLLEHEGERHLVDCGLFQGWKPLRERNWAPFPVAPASIATTVLTHAHIDHSGYLPLLVRNGFAGPVVCSTATRDLCRVLLPDSGYLQEKDAEFANRKGFSKHRPAVPLYTEKDAQTSLQCFAPIAFGSDHALGKATQLTLHRAGHILGAAIAELRVAGARIVFSGDLGRPDSPILPAPATVPRADYLVVESTYGDRRHGAADVEEELASVIRATAKRGGTVLVPAFAVGRTQMLLYYLHRLARDRRIPSLPIYLDSPMAINASEIFCRNHQDHRLSEAQSRETFGVAEYVRDVEDSKALDADDSPKVIVSASGMLTGGRVLHHLKVFGRDPRHTILFTGFQAPGTRGEALLHGAERVKVHGGWLRVRAEIRSLDMLSAHADADEILGWLRGFESAPRMTFINHGEPRASDALRVRIHEELGWPCHLPEQGEQIAL